MAVTFVINKGKKLKQSIYVRVRDSMGKEAKRAIPVQINKTDWSKKVGGLIKPSAFSSAIELNAKMRSLKSRIEEEVRILKIEGQAINSKWLQGLINNHFDLTSSDAEDKTIFLIPFVQNFIEKLPNRIVEKKNKPVSKGTIKAYKTTSNKLRRFEEYRRVVDKEKSLRIKIKEVDDSFFYRFKTFLMDEYKNGINTVRGELKQLKSMLYEAQRQGLKVDSSFKRVKIIYAKTNHFSITYEEFNKVYELDVSENVRLQNVKDIFVIGFFTGLRISDILRLNTSMITSDNCIRIKPKKTDDVVVLIPISKQVQEILDRRNGAFPRSISDVKFNLYLKELTKLSGLNRLVEVDKAFVEEAKNFEGKVVKIRKSIRGEYPIHEVISSHVMRRSFCSYFYGKLDTLTIMRISGHSTEKQFLDYVRITPEEHANKMKELWLKMGLIIN